MSEDLWERLAELEQDQRWWKRLAVAALGVLAILLLLGGGLGVYQYRQAQVAQLRAAQAAAEAQAQRDAARKALQKVEAAVPQAEPKAAKQAAPGAPRKAEEKGQGKRP